MVSGIPLSPSNLRPFGAPPSIGRRECPREPLPLEGAAERSEAGLASFFAAKPPPLCLPHWGRGTAPAVDRVLSLIARLRRSHPLFFIPLSPSNLRPFGAPPSIGRRECSREPLPLEGAAERSEAGLAFFLRRSRLLFAFPIGEGLVSGIPLSPSNFRPFGAPPSYGRRVCPREPLPLEGAAERSEAGLASFLRRSRLLFAFPIGECY